MDHPQFFLTVAFSSYYDNSTCLMEKISEKNRSASQTQMKITCIPNSWERKAPDFGIFYIFPSGIFFKIYECDISSLQF